MSVVRLADLRIVVLADNVQEESKSNNSLKKYRFYLPRHQNKA